jgi:hypothetical protein
MTRYFFPSENDARWLPVQSFPPPSGEVLRWKDSHSKWPAAFNGRLEGSVICTTSGAAVPVERVSHWMHIDAIPTT